MKRQYLRSTHLRWSRCHSWTSCSTTSVVPRRSLDSKWAPSASSAKTVYWANGDFLFCSNSIYLFSQKKDKNQWKKNRTILFVKKSTFVFQKATNQGEKFNMNWEKKNLEPQCAFFITCKFWNWMPDSASFSMSSPYSPFYLNFKGDPESWSHSRCPGLHLIWLFLRLWFDPLIYSAYFLLLLFVCWFIMGASFVHKCLPILPEWLLYIYKYIYKYFLCL